MTDREYLGELIKRIQEHDYYDITEYGKAIDFLFHAPYTPYFGDDVNRVYDIESYREELGFEDPKVPSILELMVSLSVRIERSIMLDGRKGDRTSEWFWNMFDSLGFTDKRNDMFDEDEAYRIIRIFNKNQFKPNGSGGLYTVKSHDDMRQKTVWQQTMTWLNEYNK